MPDGGAGLGIVDRRLETEQLDRLVSTVRGGEAQVLVLRGEAGIGKTVLLEYLRSAASGCRITAAAGVESEMELPYAGLHQLCAGILDRLTGLPEPQRDAMNTAFGLEAGVAPDRFLVGMALIGLLSDAAAERPLLCIIDDAQWLDHASAQALAFAARRLLADAVGLVFAVREPTDDRHLAGLPELVVPRLRDGDARTLFDAVTPGRLDDGVRDRIIAEARGNPLALLELPRRTTSAELAGGFGLPDRIPIERRVEQAFSQRLQSLPVATQQLLLTAAAEPVGDVTLLWDAAARLGLEPDAAVPAEAAGLIEFGTRVRFRHPLVRSAAYRSATVRDRRRAHGALAEATDPEAHPDRRAWHRAHATTGPNEDVAAELERSASRARARGGVAAAAAFLQRATELSQDPARRGRRALDAAQAKLDAGSPDAASELAAVAELCPLDELQRARLVRLLARLAFTRSHGSDAPPLLLAAAKRLEPLDPGLARETYLDALGAAIFAGRLSRGSDVVDIATAALAAPTGPQQGTVVDLLLEGLSIRLTEGYVASVGPLRRALHAVLDGDGAAELPWLPLACRIASEIWDDETWELITARHVRVARDTGALGALSFGLTYRSGTDLHAGEFAAAEALIEEADALMRSIGTVPLMYTTVLLGAWRGEKESVLELCEWGAAEATERGEGRAMAWCGYGLALLHNGLGEYEEALVAAQWACAYEDVGLVAWPLVELVEAAARCDRPDVGAVALQAITERAEAAATDWAMGFAARSRALLSDGDEADALYREAIARLGKTRVAVHLARAHLIYGEWLRRQARRREARDHLRQAHDHFARFGAEGFAGRAARELQATGETVARRAERQVALTSQEAQVARLAAAGHTNQEIGAQLFISARTAEYHLRKVFAKLDITSRRQLRTSLAAVDQAAAQPGPAGPVHQPQRANRVWW